MMTFLHPSYLWALWGLLVPIAIHLWSKKKAKTIKVGSVQLLSESKSKRSSSLQLNEWLLLLLRLIVLSLVVLLMAKPQWRDKSNAVEVVYLVEPSLAADVNLKPTLDSLSQENEVRLLEKHFPAYSVSANIISDENIPDYWRLASEMDALKTDSIVVLTKGLQQGLKGMRPRTQNNIHWIQMDEATSAIEKPIWAYKDNERVRLVSVISNAERTSFITNKLSVEDTSIQTNESGDSIKIDLENRTETVPFSIVRPLEVTLFYSDSLKAEKEYIETSFMALASYLNREINVNSEKDFLPNQTADSDLTVWLSRQGPPKSYQKLLIFKPDSLAHELIEKGEGNTYFLTDRLNLDNVISQHFTEKLLLLLDLQGELMNEAQNWDLRKVAENVLITTIEDEESKEEYKATMDISPWFWMILPLLMIIERIVAFKRKH